MRSSSAAILSRSALGALGVQSLTARIVKRQLVAGVARLPEVTQEALHMCCSTPVGCCCSAPVKVLAPAEGLHGRHRPFRARYSDFAICSCGGISQICQWYRVCDAGALRAEPLGHPFILRGHYQPPAAASPQNEAEESDATEEEETRERTTRRGRPRGGMKVAARICERLRREIGRGGRPRVGDG